MTRHIHVIQLMSRYADKERFCFQRPLSTRIRAPSLGQYQALNMTTAKQIFSMITVDTTISIYHNPQSWKRAKTSFSKLQSILSARGQQPTDWSGLGIKGNNSTGVAIICALLSLEE
jgi:hypothetical protein